MENRIFTLRTLSPLHCGIGQGLNDIDLPTARNSVTGHPIIPGSSLKGVLKDHYQSTKGTDPLFTTLFGLDPEQKSEDNFASAIAFGDCNLVALPVRSFYGTFCYLASPITLRMFKTLYERCGISNKLLRLPKIENFHIALTKNSLLKGNENTILLEELDLLIEKDNEDTEEWAEVLAMQFFTDPDQQEMFKQRFAIADENVLNFLCTSALPVDAHIAIDDKTGTVKPGMLWYEETVPPESLFAGVVGFDKSHNKACLREISSMIEFLGNESLFVQIGGKATTGKGFVVANFLNGAN
jgi:CRISPR-associated protein Cmr4